MSWLLLHERNRDRRRRDRKSYDRDFLLGLLYSKLYPVNSIDMDANAIYIWSILHFFCSIIYTCFAKKELLVKDAKDLLTNHESVNLHP